MLAQNQINKSNITDIVRCLPDEAKAVLVFDLRKAYEKENAYMGRWVEQALERLHSEQQQLDRWLEEHESGGGPLSKEDEAEYWTQ